MMVTVLNELLKLSRSVNSLSQKQGNYKPKQLTTVNIHNFHPELPNMFHISKLALHG